MNWWEAAQVVAQLARAGGAWVWHNTRYPSPVPDNPKFMSPRDAVSLISDGDVVAVSGLGGQQHASILYWAIRERFEESGRPARLTLINVGGHGGRGIVPGTLEELARPGLCTRFITSHFEMLPAMLDLGAAGQCELHCLPLGVMTLLFDALGRGQRSVLTRSGIGTFLDPRVGRGTPVTEQTAEQFITVQGNRARYRMPEINVAILNVPAADRRGNLYLKHCATIGESDCLARAARRSGGRVIANVGLVVDEGYDAVFLPAGAVDAVVVHPDTEQTAGVFHRRYWPVFTTESDMSIEAGLERVRLINWLAGVTRQRTAADAALARLAAATLVANVSKGACVSIGTGLPEEVCPIIYTAGLLADLTFVVESGVIGGLPSPGVYFGTALCPEKIVPSAEFFKRCVRKLDATCLGVLQADSLGNVNVSRRGEGLRNYVGPGGFIDFTTAAQVIVFVSAWMHHGEMSVDGGTLRLVKRGAPKFIERVDEVTFNGPQALTAGKQVFYATHVGIFRLTERGMELAGVMPGIDVRADILEGTPMRVVLPKSGKVPVLPRSLVSGDGFALRVGRPRSSRRRDRSRETET